VAIRTQQIYADNPGNITEAVYIIPPGLDLDLHSVRARIDGAGAVGSFIMVCELLTSDNRILAQSPVDQTFAVSDTGALTWAPFLRQGSGSSNVIPQLSLFDLTLAADAASVDTTGTDLSGGHVLEVWVISRTDQAGAGPNLAFQFNGDTGANYDYDWVRNAGGALSPVDFHADTAVNSAESGSSYAAGAYSVTRATIPGYDQQVAGVNKVGEWTTYVPNTSTAPPGAGIRVFTGGFMWRNDARITSIQFAPNAGFVMLAGSRFLVLRR